MITNYEFPQPDHALALCDIDGTLINKAYQFTDPAIKVTVAEAQTAGWTIGLSSDTPYEGMTRYRDILGMNGPIIAEKGSVVEWGGELYYDIDEAKLFSASYDNMRQSLQDTGIVVWEGNPVVAISEQLQIGKAGDNIVLMNSLRKCSLGLFARRVNGAGEMVIDQGLTEEVIEQVKPLYPDVPHLDEDLNHDYGLLILAPESVTKRKGSQRLLEIAGLTGKFAMIGNSAADYVGGDIAVHYAVKDATEEFRNQADYTASLPVTGGTVEILRKLTVTRQDNQYL